MAVEPKNRVVKSQNMKSLTLNIGNKEYHGYYQADSDRCEMSTADGEKLMVFISPLDKYADGKLQQSDMNYPHLLCKTQVVDNEGKWVYDCYQCVDRESYMTIETALFGNVPVNLIQRIILSLSLSAAMSELEAYLGDDRLSAFDLDAILVDKSTYSVLIDMGSTERSTLEKAPFRKAYHHGVLPPECYEDERTESLGVLELRYMLAVMVFRALTAADPYDGMATLTGFPYRSEGVLKQLYGNQAEFVYGSQSRNKTCFCIGKNVEPVFTRICPRLKEIFDCALNVNRLNPAQRPTADDWVNNQKKMLEWMSISEKGWLIPDFEGGEWLNYLSVSYLRLDNGVVLPAENKKLILQYMLEPQNEPVKEELVGSIVILHNGIPEFEYRNGQHQRIRLIGKKISIGNVTGRLVSDPRNK